MQATCCTLCSKSAAVGLLCRNCYQKQYYQKNKESLLEKDKVRKKKAYLTRKDVLNKKCRNYYNNNKDAVLLQKQKYNIENNANITVRKNEYYRCNRDRIIKENKDYIVNRCKTDHIFRLARNLRSRLNKAIKGDYKSGSAVKDLGCSISELKTYLELQFQPDMTWENYGLKSWHVDHIIPLSSFDLSDFNQLKKACHYTNLQPLWAKDNLKKGAK